LQTQHPQKANRSAPARASPRQDPDRRPEPSLPEALPQKRIGSAPCSGATRSPAPHRRIFCGGKDWKKQRWKGSRPCLSGPRRKFRRRKFQCQACKKAC